MKTGCGKKWNPRPRRRNPGGEPVESENTGEKNVNANRTNSGAPGPELRARAQKAMIAGEDLDADWTRNVHVRELLARAADAGFARRTARAALSALIVENQDVVRPVTTSLRMALFAQRQQEVDRNYLKMDGIGLVSHAALHREALARVLGHPANQDTGPGSKVQDCTPARKTKEAGTCQPR